MQHLCICPLRARPSLDGANACQALVRFFALLRIKPHAPLLVRVPVNSLSFNLSIVLPRRTTYRVSLDTQRVESSCVEWSSFTARTNRVSYSVRFPCFSPLASETNQE